MKLLKKGAEADIYQTRWQNSKAILKIRKIKNYRNPLLDLKIRKQRTIKECQMISFVKSFGIHTPLVYFVNLKTTSIMMQEIPGTPVHDLPESKIIELSKDIGKLVGTLHKNGVMHGDFTTSNFILFKNTVFVIDFGLSQNTIKPEDHAVDLRLIKEILNIGIDFVLGHALYMKAIHGGKAKNDRIDSLKIATLLRGGMFPMAYVYPRADAPHPGFDAPENAHDAQTRRTARPYPEHQQPIQLARYR